MSKRFAKLANALDRENYEYLLAENEELANVIAEEVAAGANPNAIARFMLQHIGEDRRAFINRCLSAARYLESMKG